MSQANDNLLASYLEATQDLLPMESAILNHGQKGKSTPSPFDLTARECYKPDPVHQIKVLEKCPNSPEDEQEKQGQNKGTATRGLLATDHVILNHGQVTWTTPELAPPSPNYHTTPTGGHFSSRQI
ncbi:hypothetical protein TNCV_4495911 [Trichonephila clavipes]|nr:hypothetical protein TNCV_4495911 [Trichonephila clavipes]